MTPDQTSGMTQGRRLRLAYLALVGIGLLILLLLFNFVFIGQASPQACGISPPDMPGHPFLGNQFGTVGLCVVCAFVGFFFGKLTPRLAESSLLHGFLLGYEGDPAKATNIKAKVFVEVGLIAMLVFGTGALYYESFAFWNGAWPVTSYVRCGNDVSPFWAALAAGALCLVLGNWLWHEHEPERAKKRKQQP